MRAKRPTAGEGERVDDQPCQVTTHEDSATVVTGETTGLMDGSEQLLKTQKVPTTNVHVSQLGHSKIWSTAGMSLGDILVMEPLACALRLNESIKGLTPPGSRGMEVKYPMYMDDITLLLTDNKSIDESLAVCEDFTAASGMRINKGKSEVIYSKWQEIKENWGLIENFETMKILGVEIVR